MSDIKMIMINTGAGLKKVVGRLKSDLDHTYEFEDTILLEEVFTEKGMQIVPLIFAPKNKNATIEIEKSSVVVRPFDPTDEICKAFSQITSNLIIPNLQV